MRARYVVRRWWGLAGQGLLALVVAAWAVGRGSVPGFFWVVLAFGIVSLWPASMIPRVDAGGFRLGRSVSVPWSSIREVVLHRPGVVAADPAVGLRLRPYAPLPQGVKAMVYDPNRPDKVPEPLRAPVRNVDPQRLEAAVREFGGLEVVCESR